MVMLRQLLVLLLLALLGNGQHLRYDGMKVVRVVPNTEEQVHLLRQLEIEDTMELDFWTSPTSVGRSVDIMTSEAIYPSLAMTLAAENLHYTIFIDDVQSIINEESNSTLSSQPETFSLTKYNRLSDIFAWLDSVAASCDICSIQSMGKSHEGRDLKLIKIGSTRTVPKKSIFVDGTIHAREWISTATMLTLINKFVTTYRTDSNVKALVDQFDWYFLPVLNPDGYEYSHTNQRLWRKTRRPNTDVGSTCVGTDGNRNFGYMWGGPGTSTNPCSNTYKGPRAFSEVETKLLADFITARKSNMLSYVTIHSYGQYWLTPWGYTSALPPDYTEMMSVANAAASALRSYRGTAYRVGSSTNILYAAAGGADDWAYGDAKVKFSYTIELPDRGRYGFLLPPSQIAPVGEETWLAFKAMGKALLSK